MIKIPNKKYDLEDRTLAFSKRIIKLCKASPKNTINRRLLDQLLRSGTSVGANYREANDALGKKDFAHRVRIARKEAKETVYWLNLIINANPELENRMQNIIEEAEELRNILSAIIQKVTRNKSQETNKSQIQNSKLQTV